MERLRLLKNKINKGIAVDEKVNTLITNWSPNNVRRLVIGFNFAIVQYYVTGGKYKKLIEIVDFRKVLQKESEYLQGQNIMKYKSILTALVDGRICSSVEEIIFSANKYPQQLLNIDTDLSKLASDAEKLENRFVRLRQVSIVNLPEESIIFLLQQAKAPGMLVLDVLKERGTDFKLIYESHKDNWWRGTNLRSKWYSMDNEGGPLSNYFNKLKDKMEEEERQRKLDEIDSKKSRELIENAIPPLVVMITHVKSLMTKSENVYKNSSIIDKAEWSHVLMKESIYKAINIQVAKDIIFVERIRRIDFDKLINACKEYDLGDETVGALTYIRGVIFEGILSKNQNEFLSIKNKLDIQGSIQNLQKITAKIINSEVNIAYVALLKFLSRNTLKYVTFYYDQIKMYLGTLKYTRAIAEYCNTRLKDMSTRGILEKIKVDLLEVEAFGIQSKIASATDILTALGTVK